MHTFSSSRTLVVHFDLPASPQPSRIYCHPQMLPRNVHQTSCASHLPLDPMRLRGPLVSLLFSISGSNLGIPLPRPIQEVKTFRNSS